MHQHVDDEKWYVIFASSLPTVDCIEDKMKRGQEDKNTLNVVIKDRVFW